MVLIQIIVAVALVLSAAGFSPSSHSGGSHPVPSEVPIVKPKDLWVVSNAGHVNNAEGTKCLQLHPHCALCTPGFKACAVCLDLREDGGQQWVQIAGICRVVIDFEDFALPYYSEFVIPSPYAGLVWDSLAIMTSSQLYTWQPGCTNGYNAGATSGHTVLFTWYGNPGTISSPSPTQTFCAVQLSVTSAWVTDQVARFVGTDINGNQVQLDAPAKMDSPSLVKFPETFCAIKALQMVGLNYECNCGGCGNHLVIDDIVLA